MIEFGAGGTVTQNDADATANNATTAAVPPAGAAANENAENAEGTNGENDPNGAQAVPVTVPPPVPAQPPRRKRKAKGWYCPVCRQRAYFLFLRFKILHSIHRINCQKIAPRFF